MAMRLMVPTVTDHLRDTGRALVRGGLSHVPLRRRSLAPSLYDLHPWADSQPHAPVRLETISSERVHGTVRHPSTVDTGFVPVRELRTSHWAFRFGRVREAMESLAELPPVELLQVGDEYFVLDGHNRVAAAKQLNADLDAHVTEIRIPGLPTS